MNEREYFNQDFSAVCELLDRIRTGLLKGKRIYLKDLDLYNKLEYTGEIVYITLFQAGKNHIRYGSKRTSLEECINRDIEMIRKNKSFNEFSINDKNACRIMIEAAYDRRPIERKKINQDKFDNNRFEPGITGLELKKDGVSYYYMPTDAVVLSHMSYNKALQTILRRTPIGKLTNKFSERLKIFSESDYECFIFKSRAFVSFKDSCIPLYRGNIRYTEFNRDILFNQVISSSDWLIDNMYDDGRFLYYYDCAQDNFVDHEHPNRKPDNLYYNDLRHCGGVITLLRAFQLTNDEKYIIAAKKGINWSLSILSPHNTDWGEGLYAHYNDKGKLGGTGLVLVSLMRYRIITGDKSYDEYIKGCTRHIMSRITPTGEMLGYFVHPLYNNGEPLINMTDNERKETFSFYYPGEALLGLGLMSNNFEDDIELVKEVRRMSKKALDWIIDERPKIYSDLFTLLPSDAWLMQAIEEWVKDENFRKDNYINFVFKDADVMMNKMYKCDDSPYIDYEGGYYYNYGDHFYPDGARSEGLVAAYYLAKYLDRKELAQKILEACKKAAICLFHLYNCEENTYAHKNPDRSIRAIRFKATRQWVRVDSIQHTACFFARLYKAA